MKCRFFPALLVALALAGSFHAVTFAKSPRFLVCDLADGELLIVIENFGGIGGAVRHCVHHWRGRPSGVVN